MDTHTMQVHAFRIVRHCHYQLLLLRSVLCRPVEPVVNFGRRLSDVLTRKTAGRTKSGDGWRPTTEYSSKSLTGTHSPRWLDWRAQCSGRLALYCSVACCFRCMWFSWLSMP